MDCLSLHLILPKYNINRKEMEHGEVEDTNSDVGKGHQNIWHICTSRIALDKSEEDTPRSRNTTFCHKFCWWKC